MSKTPVRSTRLNWNALKITRISDKTTNLTLRRPGCHAQHTNGSDWETRRNSTMKTERTGYNYSPGSQGTGHSHYGQNGAYRKRKNIATKYVGLSRNRWRPSPKACDENQRNAKTNTKLHEISKGERWRMKVWLKHRAVLWTTKTPQRRNTPQTNSRTNGNATIAPGQKPMEMTETSYHTTWTFNQ